MTKSVTWVTWTLIALNVAMFAVELASGLDAMQPRAPEMLRLGGNYAPLTLVHHEWWRVIASMFLHFGILHIAMNMICLAQGRVVEKVYGHAGFAVIYAASGIIGGIASVAMRANVVSAGASGAVFGVFGAFGAFLLLTRNEDNRAEYSRAAQRLGTFIGINLILGFQAKNVDVTAHIAGLITGFVVGMGVTKVKALPMLGATLAIAIAALIFVPTPHSPLTDFAAGEHEIIELYNSKVRAHHAKQITGQQFADAVDTEVLPKWRALVHVVDGVDDSRLAMLLQQYVKDREDAWMEAAAMNRDPSRGTVAYQALEQRVADDLAQLNSRR